MSIEIVREGYVEEVVSRERVYRHAGTDPQTGGGYGFPCDESGVVDQAALPEAAKANYSGCLDGTLAVVDEGIREWTQRYRHPSVGLCPCGRRVELGQFTNTCDCGADYNSAGSLLAPREQWGEETGEHWTECVGPFNGSELDDDSY